MKSSNNTSLERATSDEKQYRLDILNQVLDEAKNRGDSINENYLLYKMNMKGFQMYFRNMLYKDRLAFDIYPEYIDEVEDIVEFMNDILKESLKPFLPFGKDNK